MTHVDLLPEIISFVTTKEPIFMDSKPISLIRQKER